MIKIVEIPNEYMNKGLISNYPPHQKTTNIESKFFDYVTKNNSIETKLNYIPIQWTNYLVQNNKDGRDKLQKLVDKKINNTDDFYFTVVQYDGGPLVDINDCIVFSCGGMFNTNLNENTSFLPIPLLSDPHKYALKRNKKHLASFVGRNTHELRTDMVHKLSNKKDFYIKNSDNMTISKRDEKRFKKIMSESFFSLCPRGYGPASYRFYESFHLGSIPIYISDIFHLPFKEIVDYDKLCILINPNEIDTIPDRIDEILGTKKYKEMIEYADYCSKEYFTYDFTIEYIIKFISNIR